MRRIQESFIAAELFKNQHYIEIFKNPSVSELSNAFKKDYSALNYYDIRGFLTFEGDIFLVICETKEFIHEDLLKILDRHVKQINYVSSWETLKIDKYLAIFINSKREVSPSFESYRLEFDPLTIKLYKEKFESNKKLSHLSWGS